MKQLINLLAVFLFALSCSQDDTQETSLNTNQDQTDTSLNSIELIRDDMTLPHEAYPSGVLESYGWALGPRVAYGNEPPVDWSAMLPWGQVYTTMEGNPATNTRFQIRNMQAWFLRKSDNSWVKWTFTSNMGGANYAEDFQNDVSIEADIRDESNNGGGISSTLEPGYNFHFWSNDGRVTIDPTDIAGVWVSMESRLILDDPDQQDDRDIAKMMLSAGADYWQNLTAEWDQWTTNGDIGIGRFRFLTREWQVFNMHTLSNDQLVNNPPPFN